MISAIVLAAGVSSRLGRPKQLLILDGKPVLQHVVDLAHDCFPDIVVVLGHVAEEIRSAVALPQSARMVLNPAYAEGQATSLRAGLGAVPPEADAAAVLLGDQPLLGADVVRAVIARFQKGDKAVARPSFRGVPGHPVVIARRAFEAAAGAAGDEGARRVFAYDEVAEVEVDADPPVDVDTWDAYERLIDG